LKIKCRPEDFQVEELWRCPIDRTGPFTLYQLAKKNANTIDAVRHAARLAHVPMKDVFFAGLKDRHAATKQYVSIKGGPRRDFHGSGYSLRFLGGLPRHLSRKDYQGNRFTVTVRDLRGSEADRLAERVSEVAQSGVPNYFDDQRFGSLRGSGEFAAEQLIRGDAEGALKLLLARPSREDTGAARKVKKLIADGWGDWAGLRRRLPPTTRELPIVELLAQRPEAFVEAFERLERNIRTIVLHAFQSYLFNETLARLIEQEIKADLIRAPYLAGEFVFWRSLTDEQTRRMKTTRIPLASAGAKTASPSGEILAAMLRERQLAPEMFALKELRRTRFARGKRRTAVWPDGMKMRTPCLDEMNRKRWATRLSFELPSGSYATIVLKRLTFDMTTRRR